MSLLSQVTGPESVRALPERELPALCAELRARMISVCGRVGGHLGASLGAVELIVALHRVFHAPFDALVFDVGHQAYAHKLLTGRDQRFDTLRTAGGVSPFVDRAESAHDAFGAGHACTAISAALGLAAGRELSGHAGRTVAVVGDGALTGGLSFEGLNNAKRLERGLVVVLNDNQMSISRNVGAVPAMLEGHAREFFEALGFVYVGPLDGHHLPALVEAFRAAKASQKNVVIHCRTQKGKGFEPAESDAVTRGHAMGPWELRDGKLVRSRQGAKTYSEAFASALEGAMARDPRVVAVTPAMIEGSALGRVQAQFPSRVFDVGIAEQHAVTFAAGLAAAGQRPVVCIYSTFLQRAVDQVIHDVALQKLPVVLLVDRAGLVGADGATHQGVFDVAFLRAVPDVALWAALSEQDATDMLAAALQREGPTAIRFPRGIVPAPGGPTVAPFAPGQGRWLHRANEAGLCVVSHGPLGLVAVEAAQQVPGVWVLDQPALSQVDVPALNEAAWTSGYAVVEEVAAVGGLGDAVRQLVPGARVAQVALPTAFVPHGNVVSQREAFGLDARGLAARFRSLLGQR